MRRLAVSLTKRLASNRHNCSRHIAVAAIDRRFFINDAKPCKIGFWRMSSTLTASETTISHKDIQQANLRHEGQIQIRETINKGWGVFSLQKFQRGDLVLRAKGLQTFSHANSHTIQTNWHTHVIMNLPCLLLNHVCNSANLVARRNVDGAYDFYAHSDIVPSDEFTFDYETTEYELQSAFDCHCGDEDCRKRLKGFKYHGEDVLRVFGREYVAQYLLQGDNDDDDAHEHATTDAAAAHG